MIKNEKKLDDPLNESSLPNFSRLGINHHSPTSLNYPDGIFAFRYIVCSQDDRRKFEGNANMVSGVCVGDALSYRYAKVIWKMNPITKKLAPTENKVFTDDQAIDKAMEKLRKYQPVNDLDQEKLDHYLEEVPQTIRQGFNVFANLCGNHHVVCEDVVNHQDSRILLPIVGRTDFSIQDLRGEQFPPGAFMSHKLLPKADLLSVLELKCSFGKAMKRRKDGSRSFSNARLPSIPNPMHLQQLSFYYTAQKPVEAKLIYLTAEGSQIFHAGNCADLEPENMKNYYEQLIRSAKRRERLLSRHEHINDTAQMKLEILKDLSPDWNHPFYWRIGNHYLNQAKELWKNL
jgi:hypothetical protein